MMNRTQNTEVRSQKSVFCSLFSVFCLLFFVLCPPAFAETTIKVLLLESKDARIPAKDEKLERLGDKKGEMLVGGIKYSGTIEVWKGEKGLYIVNEIPLEEYIKGVVAGEVSKSWDIEALKAQAVVARTYALYQKLNSGFGKMPFHITSSVLHQVYKGGDVPDNIARAVKETKGEILTYKGQPIVAYYHSTSGGMTEDPSEVFGKSYPYLKPVETMCDLSPYYIWERSIPLSDIEKATNVAGIKDIVIDSHTVSKRVRMLKIISGAGVHSVVAKDLRKNLGWDKLPSTMITKIIRDKDAYIFEGRGYGHGVGMCQWSALGMARSGKSYREILSKFYPGTVIEIYGK
ncbi:MAG: SpoIID/LytB domain-containing protein [Thermodesulfovibrionales bacterium]|nr:SpoIID/LytB domain-containing protein [Thermodesulfovibrionales bacterium]